MQEKQTIGAGLPVPVIGKEVFLLYDEKNPRKMHLKEESILL